MDPSKLPLREIEVSTPIGGREYVGGTITTKDATDLTGDTAEISLAAPGASSITWIGSTDPNIEITNDGAVVTVKYLVTTAITPGMYLVRLRLHDHTEIVPRVVERVRVI